MADIKFGTDGWRAVIAESFTVDNVARVAWAVARWVGGKEGEDSVVVGYDTRFGGKMFAETVAKVLTIKGIRVYLSPDFVTAPMVSYGVVALKARAGIVITASHNPAQYNGIKLKGPHGGPLDNQETRIIENLIPEENELSLATIRWDSSLQKDKIIYTDLEQIYLENIQTHFDLETLRKSGLKLAFDAMYGASQNIIQRLFPEARFFHCMVNPTFFNIPPEPDRPYLMEFSEAIRKSGKIDLGIAMDGDGDRIALIDPEGNYIDSHHIILLLILYLAGYKKLKGKVVTGFSSTIEVEKLAGRYGLETVRVPIGFKEISAIMRKETVLVGGEESGGFSVVSHIPERDGVWVTLTIMQFMEETGKGIGELLKEVEAITGPFVFGRADFKMAQEQIQRILKKCRTESFARFGDFQVSHEVAFDGFKYFFNDHEWLMIRSSGTEYLLRLYAEAETQERMESILKAGYHTLMADSDSEKS
ncbi:MAG: hypothetical protein J7K46_11620 [Bacteroidales bacterium]|nr:hypothetical protein [Bacteroidales bacterium]